MATKICKKCLEEKPLEEFYRSSRIKDGYENGCKDCRAKSRDVWYEENKEIIKQKNATYYLNNKEKITKRNKKWRENNLERSREYNKQYNRERSEEINERARIWRINNLERSRLHTRNGIGNRRARLKSLAVEKIDYEVVYERDRGLCQLCLEYTAEKEFNIDHVIPLSLGGEHSYSNVQLSHASCNVKKYNIVEEWN